MKTIHKPLLTTAALAALLPAMALGQEATPDADVVELPTEVIETEEGTVVTTDPEGGAATEMAQDTTEMNVTDVTATSASEPVALEGWTYDDLYANGIGINRMVGADVYGPEGDDVGDVENVLFDMDGNILSVVAEVGGLFELDDTHLNIPWDMVSAEDWADGIVIPFGEDEADSYIATAEQAGGTIVASEDVAEVGGDGAGEVETGPNVWRATDLLNGTVRLRDGAAFANYGVVSDLVVRDGRVAAVLVTPDAGSGLVGYPYAGPVGFTPGTEAGAPGTYDLPYDRTQAETLQPFDPAMLED